MLIGQWPWSVRTVANGIVEMTRTGLIFSYYRTSYDFENNRKTMLTEVNTQLGSESASALRTQKVSPLPL